MFHDVPGWAVVTAFAVLAAGLILFIVPICILTGGKAATFAAFGGSVVSAAIVSFALLFIQSSLDSAQNERTWRDGLASATNLTGFSPDGHDVTHPALTDKNLTNARLQGTNLTGSYLNGATLKWANLENAVLVKANLQNASLVATKLGGADLTDADLRGANFHKADLSKVKRLDRASVDARTCWPKSFLDGKKLDFVTQYPVLNESGKVMVPASKGSSC
ncbi:pentapeptide repeat-containing protein [Streptomyces roseifaciens]